MDPDTSSDNGISATHGNAEVREEKSPRTQRRILVVVCALVVGVYACIAQSGTLEALCLNAGETYYNFLVQGFRAGQLSLKKEVPTGIELFADPHDLAANHLYRFIYRMHDMSYYKGRLYLYFGVTPVLILYWPFAALTGHYLFDRQAVAIFCAIAFLAGAGLLYALWRRYFAEVSFGVVVACVMAFGLATGVPLLLVRCDIYEVPVSCAYMLTTLALGAIWCALHNPERRGRWLVAASLACGLALGARPSYLLGAGILLVPVLQAWRQKQRVWPLWLAALSPITLIAVGLMLYNALRFDNPVEFGQRYQLPLSREDTRDVWWSDQLGDAIFRLRFSQGNAKQQFGLHYLWFNIRVCYLEPARWGGRFPFVHDIVVPPLPKGGSVEHPLGVLTNFPVLWLALAVPLAWRGRTGESRSTLRWFLAAVGILFGGCALTMGLHNSMFFRYEMEFLPSLGLLAVIGILGLERVLAPISESEQAPTLGAALTDHPVWRRTARCGWILLLGFSLVFNFLAGVDRYAQAANDAGVALAEAGRPKDAIAPYEQAVWLKPDYPEAHNNLGVALERTDRIPEAIAQYEQALQLRPDYPEAHHNLGIALERAGRFPEAVGHFEQALRLKPDYTYALYDLGIALAKAGQAQEAIGVYERVLKLKPDLPEAHNNLGSLLAGLGRMQEAIGHWEQALGLKPDFAEARNNLGSALLGLGKVPEAIEQYEQALRLKPDYAKAHFNLGTALEAAGRVTEAIGHYEQALQLKPDFGDAENRLARLRARQ